MDNCSLQSLSGTSDLQGLWRRRESNPRPVPHQPGDEPNRLTVAALFVEKGGSYYGLDGVDPWDEERDARLYAGPWPVVAHPPCKRWCMFAKGIETRFGYRVGDDDGCFEAALHTVRTYGGILEHPAHSLAWAAHDLPVPNVRYGWTTALGDPGASCYIEQGRYGLPVRKATWLYACHVELPELRWGFTSKPGEYKWHQRRDKLNDPRDDPRPRMRSEVSEMTPPEFRDALIAIARTAEVRVAA